MPCLFIDGVDLLAKQYSEVFDTLVDLAKHYANNGMLRIVLVGRDNYIVPHTEQNWHADVIEILDIDKNDSEYYLNRSGMSTSLAERVFNFTGGRFALLVNAVNLYRKSSSQSEHGLFTYIRIRLKSQCHEKKYHVYEMTNTILEWVLQYKEVYIEMVEVFKTVNETKYYKLKEAFFGLVQLEMLRYTDVGSVTWHNQCVNNSEIWRRDAVNRMYEYIRNNNLTYYYDDFMKG
jgi:hypothetical protein